MDMDTLLRGAGIGFAIAAPVGPIGLLCIRRTLAEGPAAGVATGLGAATADAVYGLIVALGFGVVATLMTGHAGALRAVGGALLVWMGIAALRHAWRGGGAAVAGAAGVGSLLGAFAGTFALTLANPMTILAFAGILAAFGPERAGGGFALVLGVFLGSTAWWLLLVGFTSLARRALSPAATRGIEAASGVALLGFGLVALAGGVG